MKAIVIGAGFGGLSIAALLAKEGVEVTVIEKNDQPGGRAITYKEGGFTYDMGPSWYLMVDVFDRFFAIFGKRPEDYYQKVRLDPSYRVFYGKGEHYDLWSDLKKNVDLFNYLEEGGGKSFKKYLQNSEYAYNMAMNKFIYEGYEKFWKLIHPRIVYDAFRLHMFDTIDKYTSRYFKDHRIKKILEYNTVFLGSGPFNTPAFYSIMAHVDFNMGVWYPMGGIASIVNGLYRLCEENGVKFVFNSPVEKIDVIDGVAKSVVTSSGRHDADIVISNADYHHTEVELLDKKYRVYDENYWSKCTVAPSAVLMYLGVKKRINNLCHHNLYLDKEWKEHYATVFKTTSWPENPCYYVCVPSKTDDSVAPQGMENIYILVPVAAGLEDSDEIKEKYYNKIMDHLEELTGERIKEDIVVKKILTHRDFSTLYNAYKGTVLGLAHTLGQTAFLRPSQYSKKVKNLYYTGQYTHPGIGMPMCLISSELISRRIKREVLTD